MDDNNTVTTDGCSTSTVNTTSTTTSTVTNTVSNALISPSLMNESYYHGLLPREDVSFLLKENGDFLVRVSQPKAGDSERQIIISILADKDEKLNIGMRHVVVRKNEGKYIVEAEAPKFDSIQQLIEHYRSTNRPLLPSIESTCLIQPIKREKWELRHCDLKLSKILGHGVYGEVYKGKMKRKSYFIDVAIKLAKTAALTKERVKDIMREARMMRNYLHANVVRIYGVALDEDPLMIVMELVRGGSLEDYLRKNAGNIDDNERFVMASGAAWGIEYLHKNSCIHRDIASRNCLYDKSKVVKISDFGLSRQGEKYKMSVSQRVPIKWIAPETLTTFTFTPSSDVFAYGVLLWEIFTDGAEPFEGKKTAEIKTLLLDGVRLEFPPTTPAAIRDMVTQRIFNGRPEDRYTMTEIVQRLEQISGVKQPQPRRPNQAKKTIGRETQDECSVSIDSSRSNKKSKRKKSPRRRLTFAYQPQRSKLN